MIIGEDKFIHALVCALATLIGACFLSFGWHCIIIGAMFALGLGLGKEYGDKHATGNHWCWWDILADLIGITIGGGTLYLLWRIKA